MDTVAASNLADGINTWDLDAVNVTDFGLFIDIYHGLEGLAHVSEVDVPGGGKLGVYEPRHARPPAAGASDGKLGGKRANDAAGAGRPGAKRSKAVKAKKAQERR